MPEGPSIVLLKEALRNFEGQTVLEVSGTAQIDLSELKRKTILSLKSWGKHLLICFNTFFLDIHLMMFGTYRINQRRTTAPRLRIRTKDNEVNFYACRVNLMREDPEEVYDWSADILSKRWSAAKAWKKAKAEPKTLICDVLLDQNIVAGSGNIIKNEALFLSRVHPANRVEQLSAVALKRVLKEVRSFAQDFYAWKKQQVLTRHLKAYGCAQCPRCAIPLHKTPMGKTRRITFFCNNCQKLFKS